MAEAPALITQNLHQVWQGATSEPLFPGELDERLEVLRGLREEAVSLLTGGVVESELTIEEDLRDLPEQSQPGRKGVSADGQMIQGQQATTGKEVEIQRLLRAGGGRYALEVTMAAQWHPTAQEDRLLTAHRADRWTPFRNMRRERVARMAGQHFTYLTVTMAEVGEGASEQTIRHQLDRGNRIQFGITRNGLALDLVVNGIVQADMGGVEIDPKQRLRFPSGGVEVEYNAPDLQAPIFTNAIAGARQVGGERLTIEQQQDLCLKLVREHQQGTYAANALLAHTVAALREDNRVGQPEARSSKP
ncbi:MAG TPA: hypothetical protein VLF69_02685 [Candidatus Saccharimonadales bacterium]|nr:hypothetical protein [Candidatus Saccharimonadales bacterium]